jgi:hypothetical protein
MPRFTEIRYKGRNTERGWSMGTMTCKGCGIPKLFCWGNRWTDDGILESQPIGMRRLIMMERELMMGIFQGLEERLGVSIEHLIFEAKRKDAVLYVSDLLPPLLGRFVRLSPLRRFAYMVMIKQAALIGLGKARMLEYEPGRRLVGRISPVYCKALFTGDVFGAFESIEGVKAKHNYGEIGDDLFFNIEPWEDAPEEGRLEPEEGIVVPATANYFRCDVCGLPREISFLRWEPETGKIIDSRTGEWVFIQGIGALNAVYRELEEELGEEIPHLVADLTWIYYQRMKDEHPQVFKDLNFIKVRGLGVPDSDNPTPSELKKGLSIRNGFNGPMLAGMVAAVMGGDYPKWSWESPEEGVVKVTVEESSVGIYESLS